MSCLKVRTGAQSQRFEIVEACVNGLVIEVAYDIEIIRNGFKTNRLAQSGDRLHLRKPGGEDIALKLEKLELDLEQIPFAHVSGFEAGLADFHRLLKAVVILLCEVESGLREQD